MRVAVIGGGVAGSASAIALRRIGADVTVYEGYEDPAGPVGSFVSLAVNGLRGLDVLGCLPQVRRAGFPVARQRMWSGRGKLLGDVPRGRTAEDELLSVTLMRADLVGILREAASRAGARIITGRRLEGPGDGEAAGADVVVGADGIWSVTRRALDAAAPGPGYAGLYSVSGTVPSIGGAGPGSGATVGGRRAAVASEGADAATTPRGMTGVGEASAAGGAVVAERVGAVDARSPAGPAAGSGPGRKGSPTGWTSEFNMTFARRGAFIHLPAPDGSLWWSAQVAAHRPPQGLASIGVAELAEVFRTERRIVEILRAGAEIRSATLLHVLAPVRRRQDGRTVLIGDAAHPVGAGQGASMAIEDAVLLARELHMADGDVPVALAAFDRLRVARTGKMAKAASANRDAKTAGPLAARLRDLAMPVMFPRIYPRATSWLYTYDLGTLPAPPAP